MANPKRNMKRRGIVGLLLALAMLSPAACGGGEEDAGSDSANDAASSSDESTGTGDGGSDNSDDSTEASSSGGSAETGSDDFPIPAPDGLILDALVDAGLDIGGQRQLYYENGDFDRVVAFYDDWTGQNGEWARTEIDGAVVFQGLDGVGVRTITVTPDQDPGAQAEGPAVFVLLVAS